MTTLNIALSYLVGAAFGVVYLRMLSKKVEKIGTGNAGLSSARLALIAIPIIVATRWETLHILPIFLGFLTYKVAIVIYMVRYTLIDIK
jgi:ATP synthase protein I